MESPVQPNFIPHGAVTSAPIRRSQAGLPELLLLVSILLLIVSAALGAGVFLYTQYLQTSNASKLNQLNTTESAFDPSFIQEVTRLDSRMKAGQQLLDAHLAPSVFFTMVEQSTIQDIYFSSLSFDATNPQNITLKMSGVAGSVNSIALQAQVFSQSGIITSPIFSDINQEADGVHFDFSALVNPASISYESMVKAQSGQPAAQPQSQPQQPQTQTAPAQTSPFQPATSSSTSTHQ